MSNHLTYPPLEVASMQAMVNDVGVIYDGIAAWGIVWWSDTEFGPRRFTRFWRWKRDPRGSHE